MSVEFQTVAVFGKRDSTDFAPLKQLRDFLIRHGRNVILEKRAAEALGLDCGRTLEEIGTQADLFIIYGGDGTFLGISRRMAKYEVPLSALMPADSDSLRIFLPSAWKTSSRKF